MLPTESTPEMSDLRLFPKYYVVIYCVVFMAQISVSTSYFVSTLLNPRISSSFSKTFHVSFNLIDTWLLWACISGVWIFKFEVRRILRPQLLDPRTVDRVRKQQLMSINDYSVFSVHLQYNTKLVTS